MNTLQLSSLKYARDKRPRVAALGYTCASYQQENIYILCHCHCRLVPHSYFIHDSYTGVSVQIELRAAESRKNRKKTQSLKTRKR